MTIIIPLTQGQQTVIDDEFSSLLQYSWHAIYSPNYIGPIKYRAGRRTSRTLGPQRGVLLHREIMSLHLGRTLLSTEDVDHEDGNPLNNCLSNLRLATRAQNQCNKGKLSSNTSGYKGVTWHKHKKRWMATIKADGRNIFLGYFKDPTEAHQAYCEGATRYHGEFANFG